MKEGEGLIIEIKEYGNSSQIIKILTEEGKIAGFLKGNKKEKIAPFCLIKFKISKRLEEHLGSLKLEIVKTYYSLVLKQKIKIIVLCSLQEILTFLVEESNPNKELYTQVIDFLNFLLSEENINSIVIYYLKFELFILSNLGFGLDFTQCALTGKKEIFFISPLTGKCASFEVAKKFENKLFHIPFIYGNKNITNITFKEDCGNAFKINSHFLQNIPNFKKLHSRERMICYILNTNC
jgi:DNA repair protein RecO (recombination protein O)